MKYLGQKILPQDTNGMHILFKLLISLRLHFHFLSYIHKDYGKWICLFDHNFTFIPTTHKSPPPPPEILSLCLTTDRITKLQFL